MTEQKHRYAVDSLILLLQSIIATQAALEFKPTYARGLTIAVYVGMLSGAIFWGVGADVIGRRYAFNISLFICSVFAIAAGAAPNWVSLGFFICLTGFGAGGNLILDTAVFLEYLPSNKQWVLTWLAAWWGVGGTVAGLIAWPLMCKCIIHEERPYSADCRSHGEHELYQCHDLYLS
jgi:MFS family permease